MNLRYTAFAAPLAIGLLAVFGCTQTTESTEESIARTDLSTTVNRTTPTGPPVEEPTLAPGDPTVYAERDPRNSRLLKVMEELPLSFKEEGVWFADYARARELAFFAATGNPRGVSSAV